MRIDISDLVNVLGKELAHSDDNTQASFLNSLADELGIACRTNENLQTQLCYLSDRLNKNGSQFVLGLAEYINLRRRGDK